MQVLFGEYRGDLALTPLFLFFYAVHLGECSRAPPATLDKYAYWR